MLFILFLTFIKNYNGSTLFDTTRSRRCGVTRVNTQAAKKFDSPVDELFKARALLDQTYRAFDDSERARRILFHRSIDPLRLRIMQLERQVVAAFADEQPTPTSEGLPFIATGIANLRVEETQSSWRVTNPIATMRRARRMGLLRHVARLTHEWAYDSGIFLEWFTSGDKRAAQFEGDVARPELERMLTVEPTATYLVRLPDGSVVRPAKIEIPLKS